MVSFLCCSLIALRQLADGRALTLMFNVYAIYNQKHDKIYIGQTQDLDIRIEAHRNKVFDNSYTARFDGEWKLIYSESVSTRHEALSREKQLKTYRGREFVKKLIQK